jgi:hypothetical protein
LLVVELETGRFILLATRKAALAFADEYWDLLKGDFRFWDANGRVVTIPEAFLHDEASEPAVGAVDHDGLRLAFAAYETGRERDSGVLTTLRHLMSKLPQSSADVDSVS